MQPGPELDALIAEKVMGWKRIDADKREHAYWQGEDGKVKAWISSFAPSQDIYTAWKVVERTKELGRYPFVFVQDRYLGGYSKGKWLASFGAWLGEYEDGPLGNDPEAMNYWDKPKNIVASDSVPHVICLAALKACGVDFSN